MQQANNIVKSPDMSLCKLLGVTLSVKHARSHPSTVSKRARLDSDVLLSSARHLCMESMHLELSTGTNGGSWLDLHTRMASSQLM